MSLYNLDLRIKYADLSINLAALLLNKYLTEL
nr:MAG TPA: hypothetical protein [Bacteriophage sp.]DAX89420.1 MAG TPA: hypothetical protein [Caudoviricetes sp.]